MKFVCKIFKSFVSKRTAVGFLQQIVSTVIRAAVGMRFMHCYYERITAIVYEGKFKNIMYYKLVFVFFLRK